MFKFLKSTIGLLLLERTTKYQPNRVPVRNLAFGTGLHETTKFMVQLIEKYQGRFQSFLDIGTGTGILSIIASKCGAVKVVAIDIDPQSIRVAEENLLRNRCSRYEIITSDFSTLKIRKRFDFVAANLITQDLIDMRRKIYSRVNPNGWLAISGISLNNLVTIQFKFKEFPLSCLKILKGKKWSAILYKRRSC